MGRNVSNNSLYNIAPRCVVTHAEGSSPNIRHLEIDSVTSYGGEDISQLERGVKSNISCAKLFDGTTVRYTQLELAIQADYQAPLWIHRCKRVNFEGVSFTDGQFIWTYAGSSICKSSD